MFIIIGLLPSGLGGVKDEWLITEIMMNPLDENTGEFVEIQYQGDEDVNLADYYISDRSGRDGLVDFTGEMDAGNQGLQLSAGGVILVVDADYDGIYNHFLEDYEVDLSNVWMVTVVDGRIGNGLGNESDEIFWEKEAEILTSKKWQSSRNGWSSQWLEDKLWEIDLIEKYTPGMTDEDDWQELMEITENEIFLNELFFEDDDLWVELFNAGLETDLSGLRLEINGDDYYFENQIIAAGDYQSRLVEKIDRAGKICLYNSRDELIDETEYPELESWLSWAKFEKIWQRTAEPTIDEENILILDEKIMEEKIYSIAELKEIENGDMVKIIARVVVPVGILDKNYMWVQDDGSGIKVKWAGENYEVGDKLEIEGKINDLTYQRVLQGEKIEKIGEEDLMVFAVSGDELSQYESNIVKISGVVKRVNGQSVYLVNGDEAEIRVYLKSELGLEKKIQSGQSLEVRGLVDESSTGYRLLPRFKEDIIWIEDKQAKTLPTVGPDWMKIIGFYE